MNFVILDLEWNGTYSRRLKGFINEIIEFGAVKTDKDLNIIDTFSSFVRPQVGKHLSGKIKTLTNITNEELSTGLQFMQVISRFRKWIGDAVVLTWGTSDVLALIENCRYFCGNGHISFLKKYVDLQSYCEQRLHYDTTKQMGLSTAAQLLGIDEEDIDHHRALDDSLLSLRCLKELYEESSFMPFIQNAETKEFYDKIMFKTVIVCDLSNPLIKRSDMVFHCDLCGRRAHRKGDWQLKNKSYRAEFSCKNCEHKFFGRVQFKLKYDGLVVKKCILPYKEEPSEDGKAAETSNNSTKQSNV
ncbi:MAG TPA: 3'-5' exonuclease [Oscillospiraceae bacterium]|nr:3'-5' exonuclease [Oscillospiraceae bacterium]